MTASNDQRAMLEQLFGSNEALFQQIQCIPYAARLQIVEQMDAEIEATTDPKLKHEIELEGDVFRNLLRTFPPVDMSPEDEAAMNQHFYLEPQQFNWGLSEEEQDHIDEYFTTKENN
jgi:hypothetical protein